MPKWIAPSGQTRLSAETDTEALQLLFTLLSQATEQWFGLRLRACFFCSGISRLSSDFGSSHDEALPCLDCGWWTSWSQVTYTAPHGLPLHGWGLKVIQSSAAFTACCGLPACTQHYWHLFTHREPSGPCSGTTPAELTPAVHQCCGVCSQMSSAWASLGSGNSLPGKGTLL